VSTSALAAGTAFGIYRVTEAIGAGGMGEVYRAFDTSLKRDVAIKVLPASVGADRDRLARFQREAEVLATFSHPNIAQIYGLEEANGIHALVMELIDGPTLAERIARGALPTEEALHIALQIASALEAAHEKGIVHRDLKPANIKLRRDGTVKVLDFGIAKALAPPSSSSDLTVTAMTQTGFVLGTPAYMSPEQARGHPVDERADIWAFGCVLFEMLTGRTPLRDESTGRGRSVEALPAGVAAAVRRTLALCLESDLKKRIADIRDVRLALTGAFDAEPMERVSATSGVRLSPPAWLAGGAVLGALIATALLQLLAEPAAPPPELRLQITTPASPMPLEFALSPDGRYLTFVASEQGQSRLWLRELGAVEARPIPGTENARYPFWSTDSRSIGFVATGNVYSVSIAGGAPQPIVSTFSAVGAAWNADGGLLFTPGASYPLSYVASPGGTPIPVTRLEQGQAGHRFPHFLPDGRRFLFYAAGEAEKSGVFLGSLEGGDPIRLTAADSTGAFLAPDWVLYVQQGSLIARRLDLSRGVLVDDPVIVAAEVGSGAMGKSGFSLSSVGQIALRAGAAQRSQLRWRDRTGAAAETAAGFDAAQLAFPELSRDGRHVAAQRLSGGNWDLWWLDLPRGSASPLTRSPANEQLAVWSPDGTRIAHSSNRGGVLSLYLLNVRGGNDERPIVESPGAKQPQSWSNDGRFLLHYEIGTTTGRDLWSLDFGSGERRVFVNSPFEERAGQFSPDGRWVAYETNASGRYEVVVRSFPEPSTTWPISTRGGTQPRWSSDGTELYFVSPEQTLMAVPITINPADDRTLEVGAAAALFPVRIAGDVYAESVRAQYAVAPDGRFLINETVDAAADVPITLILNWTGAPGQ
jgi:Tol biopolymer transport system component